MPGRNRFLKFQLTRPVWGEPNKAVVQFYDKNISTHSPRVGRTLDVIDLC